MRLSHPSSHAICSAITLSLASCCLFACETKTLSGPDADVEASSGDVVAGSDEVQAGDADTIGDGGETADAGGQPECPVSAVCPNAGSRCVGDDLVVCSENEDGCLTADVTFCVVEGTVCTATDTGAACTVKDVCAGLPGCVSESTTCEGSTAIVCALNGDGCLVESKQDCEASSAVCIEGTCVTDICSSAGTPCEKEGTSCEGAVLMDCASNIDGCLVLSVKEDCGEIPGAVCSPHAPARCNGEILGDFVFRRVVDTLSTYAALAEPVVDVDRVPVLTTDRVYFRVSTDSTGALATAVGRYIFALDEPQILTTQETVIPDGEGTFSDFDPLSLASLVADGDVLILAGNGANAQRGIYQRSAIGLQKRIDRKSLLPASSSTFVGLSGPLLASGSIAFNGNDFGSNGGVYVSPTLADAISILAVKGTSMPGGASGFTGISITDFNEEYSVFEGFGPALPSSPFTGPNRGIYRKSGSNGPLNVIADRHLPVIQYDGQSRFEQVEGGQALDDGVIFFGAGPPGPQQPLGFPQHKGIYQWNPDSGFSVIVDTATTIPNASGETFSVEATGSLAADAFSVSGSYIYFRGVGSVDSFVSRVGVYRWQDGDIIPILDDGMMLDGKEISDVRIGRHAASDDQCVLSVQFVDGTAGIYVAFPSQFD